MRAVVQRVLEAAVVVDEQEIARIGPGLLVLVAIAHADDEAVAARLAERVCTLRVFSSEQSSFDRSLLDTGGEVLLVSQFTLYGDTRKGRRPDFAAAAPAAAAAPLFASLVQCFTDRGVRVQTGQFGAQMRVSLVNDGPVTLIVDM